METTKSPVVDANRDAVLAWFTGKALENASAALDMLAQSEAVGEWVPKASRTVRAALSKSNVAKKIAHKHRAGLEAIGNYQSPEGHRGWDVAFILNFGQFWGRRDVDFAAVLAQAPNVDLKQAVLDCERFVRDFAPVAKLLNRLDATRPVPVITQLGASPTVTALLKSLGLDGTVASTARVCPIEWVTVAVRGKHTAECNEFRGAGNGPNIPCINKRCPYNLFTYVKVANLLWPAGTVHGASRYDHNREHQQCQACGSAIKNAFNWVPLLIDNAEGVPHSLWVGRDCSKTLFGIKVTGDFETKK